jgi:hypothetical protein
MKIQINFNLSDIIEAIDVVSAVAPHKTTSDAEGYLFVVRGKECLLYSSGESCIARAKFDLIDSSGDGEFVFPAKNLTNSLRPLAKEEETCIIEATSDEDGRHMVRYVTSPDGAEAEFGSFSPDSISRYEDDLEAATETYEFNPGVLKEAINLARAFMADKLEQGMSEALRGIEVLDKTRLEKGDGYLYATDRFMAFYFRSDHFIGKKLAIHANHIPAFVSFLSKCESGTNVTIKISDKTFAINSKGDLFGWNKHGELHDKFSHHNLKMDSLVVRVNKARFLHALESSKGALKDKDQDSIVFNYDSKASKIWFNVPTSKSKSIRIDASPVVDTEEGTTASKADSFSAVVSIRQLTELVQNMKGYDITFRGYIGKPKNGTKALNLFRTIDDFFLSSADGKITTSQEDSIPCRVTRFMSSLTK